MTSTISHPNVVQTFDYRVVHLNPTPNNSTASLSANRVVQVGGGPGLLTCLQRGCFFGGHALSTAPRQPLADVSRLVLLSPSFSLFTGNAHHHGVVRPRVAAGRHGAGLAAAGPHAAHPAQRASARAPRLHACGSPPALMHGRLHRSSPWREGASPCPWVSSCHTPHSSSLTHCSSSSKPPHPCHRSLRWTWTPWS